MDNELLEQAARLAPVPEAAAQEYAGCRDALVEAVDQAMAAHPRIREFIGRSALAVMYGNHRNHALFLSDVLRLNNFRLLAVILPWVYRTYHAHGFSYDYFPEALEQWKKAVAGRLCPESAAAALPVYDWMIRSHGQVIALSRAEPGATTADENHQWQQTVQPLVTHLLAGRDKECVALANERVAGVDAIPDFYLNVLQPALYEIGRLWEGGRISVAHEHLATAIIGRVMSHLYARHFRAAHTRGRAIVTCGANELHEVGARMVSDLLEYDGWDVCYLGANTPSADLIDMARSVDPFLIALSAAMPFNIHGLKQTIRDMGEALPGSRVRTMIGGRIFNLVPDLWQATGAHGFAPDAGAAVRLAASWWKEVGRA